MQEQREHPKAASVHIQSTHPTTWRACKGKGASKLPESNTSPAEPRRPLPSSSTIKLSLSACSSSKLLCPRSFSFLLPSPLLPVFFQLLPLFHSWELWPFKEKGSVCLCGACVYVCVCMSVYVWDLNVSSFSLNLNKCIISVGQCGFFFLSLSLIAVYRRPFWDCC